MNNNQNSRRNFLSSLAILCAGTAVNGRSLSLFSSLHTKEDVEYKWNSFWKEFGGEVYNHMSELRTESIVNTPCKGHYHKAGKMIYFSKENILAQPTWIYWDDKKTKPSDVMITFFENNINFKKISSLNRFQMEALYHVSKKIKDEELLMDAATGKINSITRIKKQSQTVEIKYAKKEAVIYTTNLIHHT
jgi:hypothetical protein